MFALLTPKAVFILSAVLFCIGTYGVLARRNLLVMLMALELQLNAVNLVIVAVSRTFLDTGGHVVVLLVIAIAAAEAAVGLAILIALFRNRRTTDPYELNLLRG